MARSTRKLSNFERAVDARRQRALRFVRVTIHAGDYASALVRACVRARVYV